MAHNNDAFYDAVVAGAGGGAQHGWLILSTPASYTPFANNIDILATAVDLQIPVIAGGASISQINLLQSITQSVLTARYPVPVAPATYIDIAKAIAAVYTELEKLLANQPTVASYGVNWLVTDWYIDGTVGDDANSGVVIGAPIKTGAELLRRLGSYAMWPQSVTVHVLANGMIDALVLRGLMMVAGTHLDVVGTPTVVANDTVATFALYNHATPVATQMTAAGIADWTPYRWMRVVNRVANPARSDAVVWIATANPAGAGLATARISPPALLTLATTTSIATLSPVWVAGDPITIETLPLVPQITIELDGPLLMTAGSQYDRRQVMVRDVCCPILVSIPVSRLGINKTVIYGNKLSQWTLGLPPTATNAFSMVYGCAIYEPDAGSTQYRIQSSAYCSLYGENITSTAVIAFCSLSYCLFQGNSLTSLSVSFFGQHIQIFDCTGSIAATLRFGQISNLSGSGNATYGLGIANGAQFNLTNTINLLAGTSNARFISAPAVSVTIPQILQADDYAQKGITPAMVAGAIIVTVPWYDNTTQRVTVSHAAFAGTPGILSVQQISTTQFTITSSSALDTSTVNWTISALGRNIFISTL